MHIYSRIPVITAIYAISLLWTGYTFAAQPIKLGYAETVIGGKLIIFEEKCTFRGLGSGYTIYLTNPRGATIGKGCAMTNALPPELGIFMVQWGSSPIRGAGDYQIDDFTWMPRGRAIMAPVLKARHEAKVRMNAEREAKVEEKTSDAAQVTAFNNSDANKTHLGVISNNNSHPPTILITPKQCSLLIEEPDPSGKYSALLVRKSNGRRALGLSERGDKVVSEGCALPNSDGTIKIKMDYEGHSKDFSMEQIKWEPKGQEWIDAETQN